MKNLAWTRRCSRTKVVVLYKFDREDHCDYKNQLASGQNGATELSKKQNIWALANFLQNRATELSKKQNIWALINFLLISYLVQKNWARGKRIARGKIFEHWWGQTGDGTMVTFRETLVKIKIGSLVHIESMVAVNPTWGIGSVYTCIAVKLTADGVNIVVAVQLESVDCDGRCN